MKNIQLSLILPIYNTEKYIIRCLNSVICQRIEDLEVIIINDCSTDNTLSIISSYANEHNNIQIINLPENKGVGYARNVGLRNAIGKYVGFIDGDDWVDVNMYDLMIKYLEKYDADIAVCGVKNEYEDCKTGNYRYRYDIPKILSNDCALNILSKSLDLGINISSIVCNKLFKIDLLKKHTLYFPVGSYNEDDYLTFLAFVHSKKIILTPDCYYHYYQRPDSITHLFSKKHINDLFATFNLLKLNLEKKQIYSLYQKEFWSFLEKCLVFVVAAMFRAEQNNIIQKQYLNHFVETYLKYFTISDLIDNTSTFRIKKYLDLL